MPEPIKMKVKYDSADPDKDKKKNNSKKNDEKAETPQREKKNANSNMNKKQSKKMVRNQMTTLQIFWMTEMIATTRRLTLVTLVTQETLEILAILVTLITTAAILRIPLPTMIVNQLRRDRRKRRNPENLMKRHWKQCYCAFARLRYHNDCVSYQIKIP